MITDIAEAEARSKAARARLAGTLSSVQQRLRPSHLAQDAVEGAVSTFTSGVRKGTEAVRSRPLAVAAVTGAIGLVMARGWIADIVNNHRVKGQDETPAQDTGLNKTPAKRGTRAKKGQGK